MTALMQWRQCPRHPRFEVSEYGDVRRAGSSKRLRGWVDADGYVRYSLTNVDGLRSAIGAHQLVALAFIGPAPSPDHEVAHENGSKLGCHFTNLRWSTRADNSADRSVHGTDPIGERNPKARLTSEDVQAIRREYREIKRPGSGRRVEELDRRYGISRSQIIRIARGLAWSHVPMPRQEAA